jgi:hypothetical protein
VDDVVVDPEVDDVVDGICWDGICWLGICPEGICPEGICPDGIWLGTWFGTWLGTWFGTWLGTWFGTWLGTWLGTWFGTCWEGIWPLVLVEMQPQNSPGLLQPEMAEPSEHCIQQHDWPPGQSNSLPSAHIHIVGVGVGVDVGHTPPVPQLPVPSPSVSPQHFSGSQYCGSTNSHIPPTQSPSWQLAGLPSQGSPGLQHVPTAACLMVDIFTHWEAAVGVKPFKPPFFFFPNFT